VALSPHRVRKKFSGMGAIGLFRTANPLGSALPVGRVSGVTLWRRKDCLEKLPWARWRLDPSLLTRVSGNRSRRGRPVQFNLRRHGVASTSA